MIIEKNGTIYIATEFIDKWTVKAETGKLLVAYNVSKELCRTADELREYILQNELF